MTDRVHSFIPSFLLLLSKLFRTKQVLPPDCSSLTDGILTLISAEGFDSGLTTLVKWPRGKGGNENEDSLYHYVLQIANK